MSQALSVKDPLDVLVGVIESIVTETKVFYGARCDDGSVANAKFTVRARMLLIEEEYHGTLDEMEEEIVRAKAVLKRDLHELRAKASAMESPLQAIEGDSMETTTGCEAFQNSSQQQPLPGIEKEQAKPGSPQLMALTEHADISSEDLKLTTMQPQHPSMPRNTPRVPNSTDPQAWGSASLSKDMEESVLQYLLGTTDDGLKEVLLNLDY